MPPAMPNFDAIQSLGLGMIANILKLEPFGFSLSWSIGGDQNQKGVMRESERGDERDFTRFGRRLCRR